MIRVLRVRMGGRAARSPRCAKIVKRAEPRTSGDLADTGPSGEFCNARCLLQQLPWLMLPRVTRKLIELLILQVNLQTCRIRSSNLPISTRCAEDSVPPLAIHCMGAKSSHAFVRHAGDQRGIHKELIECYTQPFVPWCRLTPCGIAPPPSLLTIPHSPLCCSCCLNSSRTP